MKIGGYAHFNGVTFFCDLFKIKGARKGSHIQYDIEWILPPKWLIKLENKFILNGILVMYYQWKVLDKRIKHLFFFLISFYIVDGLLDLSVLYEYLDLYKKNLALAFGIGILLALGIGYKKVLTVFRYHGAEHKTINCFMEHGYVDKHLIKEASRFNKRCGSNIASIFLLLYTPLWFLEIDSLMLMTIIFLMAVQITKILAEKNFSWDKYIQLLQWVTVLEPRDEEVEVALETFRSLQKAYSIYRLEKSKYGTSKKYKIVDLA